MACGDNAQMRIQGSYGLSETLDPATCVDEYTCTYRMYDHTKKPGGYPSGGACRSAVV
jgi:hypothetical protein